MRKMLVAGNWKMNTSLEEAVQLAEGVSSALQESDITIVIAPPYPWILPVSEAVTGSAVVVSAQNCSEKDQGALTGEVSVDMISPFCKFVILGHSERRHILGESDAIIADKIQKVVSIGLTPILCVGETLEERESGAANDVVSRQLNIGLKDVAPERFSDIVIAYEPVWAIGTGKAASKDDAQEMAYFLRSRLFEMSGDIAESVTIQYGGSVKPDNAAEYFAMPDVDGALVGGASLNVDDFVAIVRAAEIAMR